MSSDSKKKDIKKKVRYVPSRYKQAAENISMKASSLKDSKDSRELQVSNNSSDASSSQGSQGLTSTPTFKGTKPLLTLDESVVTKTEKFPNMPRLKERLGPLSSDSVPIIFKDKEKNDYDEKLIEAEMDLLYAEYLQMAFLQSEAKKVLVARTEYAMETLQKLWSLVSQYMHKVRSQKSSLYLMSTVIKIHEHLQKQDNILKPAFEIIPNLSEKYKNLAEAVNVNKHKLPIKDVILPEPGSEDEISNLLMALNDFISEFFKQLPNYKDIVSTADVLESYVDAAELISKALKRGLDLFQEARDLCFSEASLALS